MKKTKLLAAAGAVAAAAALLAAVLMRGPEEKAPTASGPAGTRPPVTVQTVPTEPPEMTETTAPETTAPTVQTEPEQTEEGTFPTEPEQTIPSAPSETIPELFPMELEGGRLTVHSLFPYSGMNPDAALAFGEDIAGLQLTNTSDEHMALAELTAVLADGTELCFRVEDLPPGMSAMVFDPAQNALAGDLHCVDLYGFAEFEEDPMQPELVAVSVDGIAVTLYNVSGRDLTDLRVACHGLLDGSCFGGITYIYDVASLPAGAVTVIHAVDCILGEARVVRVEIGD